LKSKYSNQDIVNAGKMLSSTMKINDNDLEEAFSALSYWRSSHSKPLIEAYELVEKLSISHDSNAIVSKRLKRYDSIVQKLFRFKTMSLRSMNDIAGCRVILSDEKKVRRLLRNLKNNEHFQRNNGYKINDYVESPQEDGYRGIHMIGKFCSESGKQRQVEVQIRTLLQHYWATSVEIVDLFQNQGLKQKRGNRCWQEFFKYASEQLAIMDGVHGFNNISKDFDKGRKYSEALVNKNDHDVYNNLRRLATLERKLNVIKKLKKFATSLKVVDEKIKEGNIEGFVLIELNVRKTELNIHSYIKSKIHEAEKDLTNSELESHYNSDVVYALISTNSVHGLREAYPNYFADSKNFIIHLEMMMAASNYLKPSYLIRFLTNLKISRN
jgi:ppGpp synthetase/RelA/SpoT-type nucleotidyltranferase